MCQLHGSKAGCSKIAELPDTVSVLGLALTELKTVVLEQQGTRSTKDTQLQGGTSARKEEAGRHSHSDSEGRRQQQRRQTQSWTEVVRRGSGHTSQNPRKRGQGTAGGRPSHSERRGGSPDATSSSGRTNNNGMRQD